MKDIRQSRRINTEMMRLADRKAKVTGTYYITPFSGTVVSSRQNTCNFAEIITVELDSPTLVRVSNRDKGSERTHLLIDSKMIQHGTCDLYAN